MAFAAADGSLWQVSQLGIGHQVSTAFTVAPGTSPAIAANRFGGWEIAVQASTSRLWTVDSANNVIQTPSAMAPHSSPAITALSTGDYMMAFQASDASLWQQSNTSGRQTSSAFSVMSGTSPAIAANISGGWKISVQASTTRMWTADSAGNVIQTPSAMNPGTSPAITGLSTGGYAMAFVASSGVLWTEGADGVGHATSLVPDGSPVIAASVGNSWVAAFIGAGDHFLWKFDSTGRPTGTGLTMAADTMPGITGLVSNTGGGGGGS